MKVAALAAAMTAVGAPVAAASPVERAKDQVRANAGKAHFGPNQALVARDVIVDRGGREHVRFDRTYGGLRVLGGDLVVHEGAGLSLTLADDLNLSTKPGIGASEARRRVGADEAELIVYARGATPRLAYDTLTVGTKADGSPSELHRIIDATDGSELDSFDDIQHAAGTGAGFFSGAVGLETTPVSGGFSLRDPLRGGNSTCDMGNKSTRCTQFTDADNAWGDGLLSNRQTTAVDAQYGTAQTWDYFRTAHGRTGIANDGRGASNRVHYGRNYNNAFWSDSCFCMTYGDGDGTTYNPFDSLDVAGHEMAHGVTSRTANLTYSGESGGLNEATSDIFGTLVEYFANNSKDTGDYLIGEKLYKNNATESKALRYMAKPSRDGVSKDCWYSGIGSIDVHYSSGPANHFFYLLAEGSSAASTTCDGSTVTGIGRDKGGQIWYAALTKYMTSSTNYAGARVATLNAARDLYGLGSAEQNAVAAAWNAVNVK